MHTNFNDYLASLYGGAPTLPGMKNSMTSSLVKDIAWGVGNVVPWGIVSESPQGQVSLGWLGSRKYAQLPRSMAPGVVQYGSEYMSMTPSAYAEAGRLTVPDQYSGLGRTLAEGFGEQSFRNLTDSARAFKLQRMLNEWKGIHLDTLTANAGLLNIGAAGSRAGRVNLMLRDAGHMAHEMSTRYKAFIGSILGGEGDPLTLYKEYKGFYSEQMRQHLTMIGATTGRRMTSAGIKRLNYESIRRFDGSQLIPDTMLTLSTSDPESIVTFAALRDRKAGTHHVGQYIPTRLSKGVGPAQLHPLIAPEGYNRSLSAMRGLMPAHLVKAGGRPDKFGSVVRSDVGYLWGEGAERFWEGMGGEAGAFVTSKKLFGATAAAHSTYKRVIPGVIGMPGIPDAASMLSQEVLELPGLREALEDPNTAIWRPDKETRLTGSLLGIRRGNEIRGIGPGDFVEEVRFGDTGVQFMMRASRKRMPWGAGATVSGGRATLGVGAAQAGQDIWAQGLKWGDPGIAMERWMSHYADRAIWAAGGSKDRMTRNLKKLGRMTGLRYAKSDTGLGYLDTSGGGWRKKGFVDTLASGAFQKSLAAELGMSPEELAPQTRRLTEAEAVGQLTSGGAMSTTQARAWYRRFGGKLWTSVFKGQNVRFRQNAMITAPHRPGITGMAKVRVREARQLQTKFLHAASYSGVDTQLANRAAGIVGGNVGKVSREVELFLAGQYTPLLGTEYASEFVAKSEGRFIGKSLTDIVDPELMKRARVELEGFGSLSPEIFEEITQKLGFSDARSRNVSGIMIDLSGTKFSGMNVASGSRAKGKDYLVARSQQLLLENPYMVSPQLMEESSTGMIGNIRIPRNPVAAGANPRELHAMQTMANWFNTVEGMLDPAGVTRAQLEVTASLKNISMKEMLTGSKGYIQKAQTTGFTGGRFRQQIMPGTGIQVSLTEKGILSHFSPQGRAVGTSMSLVDRAMISGKTKGLNLGERMVLSLRQGEEVFGLFKRFPGQSVQQSHVARLKLRSASKTSKRVAGKTIKKDTIWVTRLLAGLTQGDFDTDDVNFYLMSQGKDMPFKDQQRLLAAMHAQEEMLAKHEQGRLAKAALMSDKDVGKFFRQGKVQGGESLGVARALMNMDQGAMKEVFTIAGDEVAEEIAGGWHRELNAQLIGGAHEFASRQMRTVRALSGVSNEFKVSQDMIKGMAERHGLSAKQTTMALEASYVPYIYGFLKKRSSFDENTIKAMTILKNVQEFEPGSAEWTAQQKTLGGLLEKISPASEPGFGPLGHPIYEKYAKDKGRWTSMPKGYHLEMAGLHMKIASVGQDLSKHGLQVESAIAYGREPRNIMGAVTSKVLGRDVNVPSFGGEGAEELLSRLDRFQKPGISSGVVNQTARAAQQSATDAAFKGAAQFESLMGDMRTELKARGKWGPLKGAIIGAGIFAAMNVVSGEDESEMAAPPTIPNMSQGLGPTPIMGGPMDGANPGALAPSHDFARINRVQGQRRHFPGADELFMPRPEMPFSIGGSQLSDSSLGIPQTRSQAERRMNYSRDF